MTYNRPGNSGLNVSDICLEQLAIAIGSSELELGKEVLDDIHAVYRRYPAPIQECL
jgi:hypothetical protein